MDDLPNMRERVCHSANTTHQEVTGMLWANHIPGLTLEELSASFQF